MRIKGSAFLLILLFLLPACVQSAPEEQNLFSQEYESHSDLPLVLVNTAHTAIESTDQYVDAVFSVDGKILKGSIRGRGHATWQYNKKPYKIRLNTEESLLGFGESREWVLLAEYTDLSLMRTAFMFELARLAGVSYSLAYKHVELYLNNEYQGVYVLAESVQRSPSRVNIAADGFIIEDNQYWESEPDGFESGLGKHYTYKYPHAKDLSETDRKYITSFIKKVEGTIFERPGTYLDLDSFAQWFLVTELLGVYDPNIYYVLPARGERLRMGPVWDAEGSLGLSGRRPDEDTPEPGKTATGFPVCSGSYYFSYLLRNPDFILCVKRNWEALKPLIPGYKQQLQSLFESLSDAMENNFHRWPVNAKPRCWEAEFAFISDYFDRRAAWFDGYVDYLSVPDAPTALESDISDPTYPTPDAIDLGLSVLWASCNLGAAKETETGYYFAWGETMPKASYSWANYVYGNDAGTGFSKYCYPGAEQWWMGTGEDPDGRIELEAGDDPARMHLGGKWRMPTRWELWELWDFLCYEGGKLHYETRDDIYGFRIESPRTGESVFFPCAGRVDGNGIESFGKAGYYWTSSLARSTMNGPAGAYFIGVDGAVENVNEWACGRYYGIPVRPVCDK